MHSNSAPSRALCSFRAGSFTHGTYAGTATRPDLGTTAQTSTHQPSHPTLKSEQPGCLPQRSLQVQSWRKHRRQSGICAGFATILPPGPHPAPCPTAWKLTTTIRQIVLIASTSGLGVWACSRAATPLSMPVFRTTFSPVFRTTFSPVFRTTFSPEKSSAS